MKKTLIFILTLLLIISCAPQQVTEDSVDQQIQQAKDDEHDVPDLPKEDEPTNAQDVESAFDPHVDEKVHVEDVSYHDSIVGFLATPKQEGKYPGVVMIHEWWGLNDNIKNMAKQVASQGYVVLAVDLYKGEVGTTREEAQTLIGKINQEEAVDNMKSAVTYLKEQQGVTKLGSLGWCFGGKQSLQLSLQEPIDATIIYYGHLETDPSVLESLQGPVLGIFGSEDKSIPPAVVNEFDEALDEAQVENSVYIYEGVDHAFANPSGGRYAPEETKDAWTKTLEFLDENLK